MWLFSKLSNEELPKSDVGAVFHLRGLSVLWESVGSGNDGM